MKKVFLLFIGMLMSSMTFAADIVIVDNLATYKGSEPYVYNKADGKVYAYNSLNEYELYGIYNKVSSLTVAQGADKAIDFIEAKSDMSTAPYIVTDYVHTPDTRVVVECTLSDSPAGDPFNWQAVFGARAGITSKAFMFFSRQGGNDRGGYVVGTKEQWGVDGENIPHNEKIIIDCQGHEAKVFREGDYPGGEPVITIFNDSEPTEGNCPLMIFTNNNNSGRQGSDTHYGSFSALMKLYSFKIYEGEETEPVAEYRPYLFVTGDAGLKDVIADKRFHAEEGEFAIPEGVEPIGSGMPVYVGKRVNYLVDNHEYKWDGTKWVDLGEMTTKPYELPEGAVNYKNMMLWTTPADKYSCFGIPTADHPTWTIDKGGVQVDKTAYYDEEKDENWFPHYYGTSMHEPIGVFVPAVAGNTYRWTFDFGSGGWDCNWTQNNPTMHAGVLSKANLTSNGFAEPCTALGGSNGVLGFWKVPTGATYDDDGNIAPLDHGQIDFMADQDGFYLLFPFGYVSDEVDYTFVIAHHQIEEFVYPDPYSELDIYRPQLEVLLGDAEAFGGGTTDVLAERLAEAIKAAKESLEIDDANAHKEAIKVLQEALAAAQAVNITNLRKTVALAEKEGITENIEEAKAFFVDGEDMSVANTLLNKIRIARRLLHIETHENVFAGNAPEDMMDYYVYNVGQKRFLCGGDDWGAHAAVGFPGIPVTLYAAFDADGNEVENGFEIDTHLNNGGNSQYLNYGGYMDTDNNGNQDDWVFVPVEGKEGVYNIRRAVENTAEGRGSLLGFRKGSYVAVDTDVLGEDDPDNQWILVTKEDRDALVANASAENPVDVSYLIQAPGFSQRESLEAWLSEPTNIFGEGTWGRTGNYPDFVWECWNGGNNRAALDMWQELELPAAGYYVLSVQGYYREGSVTNQIKVLDETGERNSYAEMYVIHSDFQSQPLWNITEPSFVSKAPGYAYVSENYGEFPNSCTQAYENFQLGLYWNTMKIEVTDPSFLQIGIQRYADDAVLEDWTVVDNFRLTYYGTEDPGDAVGVKGINEKVDGQATKIYNLQGMQVKNTKQNGIYILNGKKVIVK